MFRQLLRSRAKHVIILLPLGLAVGTVVGGLFGDVAFGVVTGAGLGTLLGGLFALRAR